MFNGNFATCIFVRNVKRCIALKPQLVYTCILKPQPHARKIAVQSVRKNPSKQSSSAKAKHVCSCLFALLFFVFVS